MHNLNYGIIGNCRSAALISDTGSLDWCCLPEFDSSSVFARILDEKNGGRFEILVKYNYEITQAYERNTSILVTRFSDGENIFEIHDFMPRYSKMKGRYNAPPEIVRYFKHVSGKPRFSVRYDPRLEYAKGKTDTHIKENFCVREEAGKEGKAAK